MATFCSRSSQISSVGQTAWLVRWEQNRAGISLAQRSPRGTSSWLTRAVHEAARHHLRANTPTREPQVVKEVLQAGIVSVPQQQRQDTRGIPSWTAWYDFEPSPSTLPGVQF